ncbi:MAG: transcriptional repressor [Saprospiraceae bacterium]|nr:transcriptional repressor [Saprospiraceae bacterium]
MNFEQILKEKELKITPQRLVVFEAIYTLKTHPTAEEIIVFIKERHPNISVATVYKVLDVFVEKGIVRKVKTENEVMRYDAFMEHHHHLFCADSNRIEDYQNEELDTLLRDFFDSKKIKGFKIKDFQLHITGTFKNK